MAEKSNLQRSFLDALVDQQVPVSVYLTAGIRLMGVIVGHDAFTLQLVDNGRAQTVYKRAVSTISPTRPLRLFDDPDDKAEK